MAEEFNLEESSAYFASDKLKDFVKKQSAFDKAMLSKSAFPMALFDFTICTFTFLSIQAAGSDPSVNLALFFSFLLVATSYSLGLFNIRLRFDRWYSLMISLKSWIISFAFLMGTSDFFVSPEETSTLNLALAAFSSGILMYLGHWYLARGLRHHAHQFVIMGEPSATTIALLKEVRRPREVISYRHNHKLYHLIANQKNLDPSAIVQALIDGEVYTIVMTSNHIPSTAEEALLIEAQKAGINCLCEKDLWEDITKCSMFKSQSRSEILKTIQIELKPSQAIFSRLLDVFLSSALLVICSPLFLFFYITASMRLGTHALEKQSFIGKNHHVFEGKVLIFGQKHHSNPKELKIGKLAQNSFFERWSWQSGIWKFPLLINVLKGDMSIVGAPLKRVSQTSNSFSQTLDQKKIGSLSVAEMIVSKTTNPGLISHFELTEQEPTYFENQMRLPDLYTLYYKKQWSILLDLYLVGLCLFYKIIGRSPQRAWLEC